NQPGHATAHQPTNAVDHYQREDDPRRRTSEYRHEHARNCAEQIREQHPSDGFAPQKTALQHNEDRTLQYRGAAEPNEAVSPKQAASERAAMNQLSQGHRGLAAPCRQRTTAATYEHEQRDGKSSKCPRERSQSRKPEGPETLLQLAVVQVASRPGSLHSLQCANSEHQVHS